MPQKSIAISIPKVNDLLSKYPEGTVVRGPFGRPVSGPQWNKTRYLMQQSGKSYPEELWVLGTGYDVFGLYANGNSTLLPIFNWARANTVQRSGFTLPEIVSVVEVKDTESTQVQYSGADARELHTKLSGSVDVGASVLGLFSGEVEVLIDSTEMIETRNRFNIFHDKMVYWKFSFDPRSQAARQLLLEEAKDAIDNIDPILLFQLYGTHFLNSIAVGARFNYGSSTNVTNYQSRITYTQAAKAHVDFLLGKLSANEYLNLRSEIAMFANYSRTNKHVVGGEPATAAKIGGGLDLDANRTFYHEWLDSVSSNQAFMDFGSRNALTGIWTLASTPARSRSLQVAAMQYLAAGSAGRVPQSYPDYVVDVVVIEGDSSSIEAPGGYTKDGYDLNRKAGGKYIYECYRKENGNKIIADSIRPIVDLRVIFGKNKAAPAGFEKIQVDLNNDAGGEYIYLCKKRGQPGKLANAIRDIVIIGGDQENPPAPYGYTRLLEDLNEGAGGKYIYLCYIR